MFLALMTGLLPAWASTFYTGVVRRGAGQAETITVSRREMVQVSCLQVLFVVVSAIPTLLFNPTTVSFRVGRALTSHLTDVAQ